MLHANNRMFWPVCCAAIVVVVLLGACAGPPLQAMSDARQMIAVAAAAGADSKAPERLQAARGRLREAESLLMNGDYKAAKTAASDAREQASSALVMSHDAPRRER
jgi:hypothetical protein